MLVLIVDLFRHFRFDLGKSELLLGLFFLLSLLLKFFFFDDFFLEFLQSLLMSLLRLNIVVNRLSSKCND